MKIRLLDEHTINQIAAGEVIENPASVVKELVENALDAGATEVGIEIKSGGRQMIRITDNGCGMTRDDALLCLERHATSKIRSLDDIFGVDTMGFRGEAIPSIASISKFNLITFPQEGNHKTGTLISVDGGKVTQCADVARSPGTTVEVNSLFFNVPVRKKFQRSPIYDTNEIVKVITGLALGNPLIQFRLVSDQKVLLSTAALPANATFQTALSERIRELLGRDYEEYSRFLEANSEGYHVAGFIGLPSFTRHNRSGQYLFINRRLIVSSWIGYLIREAYGTMLPTNKHPVYVLHLTLPGEHVDVNVHPQKREVRFRQEQILKTLLTQAIPKALHGSVSVSSLESESVLLPLPSAPMIEKELPKTSFRFPSPFITPSTSTVAEPVVRYFAAPPPQKETQLTFAQPIRTPSLRILTTIPRYILVDPASVRDFPLQEGGLCLVHQKAAQMRIVFERLTEREGQPMAVQALLIPYTFEVAPLEQELLLEHLDALNSLGIAIRQLGPRGFIVDALPQFFGNSDVQSLIQELMREMREDKEARRFMREREKCLARAVSRASATYDARLMLPEAQALLDQLMRCQVPYQCPFGKPTLIQITGDEIAKRF